MFGPKRAMEAARYAQAHPQRLMYADVFRNVYHNSRGLGIKNEYWPSKRLSQALVERVG